jgi:Ser/Thr protein kinase RdoA (MazF antagonist)
MVSFSHQSEQLASLGRFARLVLSTHDHRESLSTFVDCHGDLNMDNVLVRDDGEVVDLLDFEFSESYPLWFAVGAPDWMSDE